MYVCTVHLNVICILHMFTVAWSTLNVQFFNVHEENGLHVHPCTLFHHWQVQGLSCLSLALVWIPYERRLHTVYIYALWIDICTCRYVHTIWMYNNAVAHMYTCVCMRVLCPYWHSLSTRLTNTLTVTMVTLTPEILFWYWPVLQKSWPHMALLESIGGKNKEER